MVLSFVAQNFTQHLIDGSLIPGVLEVYTQSMGAPVFYGLVMLVITAVFYIRTQSIEFVAGIWILIGGAIEVSLPGPVLSVGKILMTLGFAVFFMRLFLGRRAYG